MSELEIGGQFDVEPNDKTKLVFSWVGHFDDSVELADAGTFEITHHTDPTSDPVDMTVMGAPAPPVLLTGSLSVEFIIEGGTVGRIYRVSHSVVTNEPEPQHRKRSFFVQVRKL